MNLETESSIKNLTENTTETPNEILEENNDDFKEESVEEINDKLTMRLYINKEGQEMIGIEHFALKETEIDELFITRETFEKMIKKARYWFC